MVTQAARCRGDAGGEMRVDREHVEGGDGEREREATADGADDTHEERQRGRQSGGENWSGRRE